MFGFYSSHDSSWSHISTSSRPYFQCSPRGSTPESTIMVTHRELVFSYVTFLLFSLKEQKSQTDVKDGSKITFWTRYQCQKCDFIPCWLVVKDLFIFKSLTLGIKSENAGMKKCVTHLIYRPALENSGQVGWNGKAPSFTFPFLRNVWLFLIFFSLKEGGHAGVGLGWICLSAWNLCTWLKSINVCDVITFFKRQRW